MPGLMSFRLINPTVVLAFASLCLAAFAAAENAPETSTVAGQVYKGGALAPDVPVQIVSADGKPAGVSSFTDPAGFYFLQNVPAGTWRIKVSPSGENPHFYDVDVHQHLVTMKPIRLGKAAGPTADAQSLFSLDSVANVSLEESVGLPAGLFKAKGNVSFNLDRVFATQTSGHPERAVSATFSAAIQKPSAVHILLSGSSLLDKKGKTRFAGQPIGVIRLEFSDGAKLEYSLTAWETVREGWTPPGVPVPLAISRDPAMTVTEIYSEARPQGTKNGTAVLDMLSIRVPELQHNATLQTITIEDTSAQTVKSPDPGLVIAGITVSHTPF
jgi:hypothetical protein